MQLKSEGPSPMLKKAIAEMAEIAKKYDVGTHIILVSQDHGEFLLQFPTWSKAQLEGNGIRFFAKGKDEDLSIASTVHMLQVFQDVGSNLYLGMTGVLQQLGNKMIIKGGPERVDEEPQRKP